MISSGEIPIMISPAERGEANVAKLRNYLERLRQFDQCLPVNNNGEPNRTAIAAACGFGRNVLHTNKAAIRLLSEFISGGANPADANPVKSQTVAQAAQIGALEQRAIRLEQRLAVVLAERDELRAKLGRYRIIEEDVLKKGRRIIS